MRLSIEKGILVVDDSPEDLRLISKYLIDQSYQVKLVLSGAEALDAIDKQRPTLILLDVRMPEMDGFELCRRLKSNEKTADIPVIYLSAAHETEHVVKGLRSGAIDYITKPVKEAELLARISVHLGVSHTQLKLEQRNIELQQINQQLKHTIRRYQQSQKQLQGRETLNRQLNVEQQNVVKLTPRELECLSLLAQGKRTGQIADHLEIKPVTVEFHISNARNKLGAKTREQALAVAIMQGLMGPAID